MEADYLFHLVEIGMALSILNHPMTIKVAKAKDDGGEVSKNDRDEFHETQKNLRQRILDN
jgi:hypothetical protein